MGLREEKKQATRTALADAALRLFMEHGFEGVTVADVAHVARVSVNTVFNYFPTKEDLFFDRQDEVIDRLPAAIRARAADESMAAAARRAFLSEIDRQEVTLGMHAGIAGFWRVVDDSPSLQGGLRRLRDRTESALAETLREVTDAEEEDPMPEVAAAMLTAVDAALHAEIRRRVLAGEHPDAIRERVREMAEVGFEALEHGLATYGTGGHAEKATGGHTKKAAGSRAKRSTGSNAGKTTGSNAEKGAR
ncbi:TetR family transcriptional regulator [Actinoplanes ianthinogenes]|uniref:TetR family transcriptional regulator n=1 Tax=Actinoplanes ianthinogenes TaxID=122358 RepID=A0ABM7LMW3_9ACTN|nr:TetR/AcrR family transcriptional regulator [Actinoplanes ianthinogenes]BCJ40625.1 TetR family transcriptional regulator [Actinoplanes ianthinogenes]GGR44010.1 TetR family transcriptional regulator [Actinoplanes ianthinogenes]